MKSINIPKVDPEKWITVEVFKLDSVGGFVSQVELKGQMIAGLKIEKGNVINTEGNSIYYDSLLGTANVLGVEVNKLLRYVYLEQLRNNK